MENCQRCDAELNGRWCAKCGEDNATPRISFGNLLREFFGSFFSYDSDFNTTMRLLLLRPEELIRNYIKGIRSPYYNPIRLAIIFATINAILFVQLDLMDAVTMQDADSKQEQIAMQYMGELMTKYMNFLSVGIIPFLALFTWLFFRSEKWNYAEHLLMSTYLYTFVIIIGVASIPLQIILRESPEINVLIGFGFSIVYLLYALARIFGFDAAVVVKTLLAYVLSFAVFVVFMTLGVSAKMFVDYRNGNLPLFDAKEDLYGYWELQSMERADSLTGEWAPYREEGVTGVLNYDRNGHVSLHLQSIDYFYTGTYELLKGDTVVQHTRLTHSDPSEVGVKVKRRIEWSGDTLIIRPVEEQNAALRLKWLKQE